MELKPEGTGFRSKTRFAKFYNLPELISIWKESADIQTADMLKLPVPKAEPITVKTEPSKFQQEMVAELGDRADAVRNRQVENMTFPQCHSYWIAMRHSLKKYALRFLNCWSL